MPKPTRETECWDEPIQPLLPMEGEEVARLRCSYSSMMTPLSEPTNAIPDQWEASPTTTKTPSPYQRKGSLSKAGEKFALNLSSSIWCLILFLAYFRKYI